jgi:phospholipid/cholesterol/gamma-HCH transport system substrate-binding protein
MRTAIRKYRFDFLLVLGTIAIALVVGAYILGNQRFYLPNWVPFIGSDFVTYKAEFTTAQSVTPGQGQTVNVAGVPIGELSNVQLRNGRAVVTMKVHRKYAHIYKDATALLRPKTGLNDMVIELTPGTPAAGEIKDTSYRIPISQTLPNVNTDEFLAALDGDTRNYLRMLVQGAGQGLEGQGKTLSAALRRFEPTNRDILKITEGLTERRRNISRSISNFRKLVQAVGGKDRQLAELVDSSNAVFKAFADQDQRLRETLRLLPGTLQETNKTLVKADKLATELKPALGKLRPGARALADTQRQTRPFFKETTPVIEKQLRPFARDALPTVKLLRPAARDLAALSPDFTQTLKVANTLLNTLAYNPKGSDEGYLFWLGWLNHLGPQVFSTQDAHGPLRRGAILFSCSAIDAAELAIPQNPRLGSVIPLVNPVPKREAAEADPQSCALILQRLNAQQQAATASAASTEAGK